MKVSEYITTDTCKEAIDLIKRGVPILHSVPVKNKYNSTQGVIDLLVRSDYLNLLVDDVCLSPDEESKKAAKLSGDYHYVVIDIKFSTLTPKSRWCTSTKCGKVSCLQVSSMDLHSSSGSYSRLYPALRIYHGSEMEMYQRFYYRKKLFLSKQTWANRL